MRKRSKRLAFSTVLLLISFVIFGLTLYFYFDENETQIVSSEEKIGITETIIECRGLDIFDSADCVNNYIEGIYYYNISNINRDMKFSLLQEEGGVCSHWATLYCYFGDKLGFFTRTVNIETGEEDYLVYSGNDSDGKIKTFDVEHMYCVWSNSEGYVVLDQTTVFKFHFKEDDEMEVLRRR
jgi:hypothetical protein